MNKKIIIIGVGAIILAFLYWEYTQSLKKDWRLNYSPNVETAYSISLFNEMLVDGVFEEYKILPQEEDFITDVNLADNSTDNYLFIGNTNYLTTTDVDSLHKFISAGNNAMIISNTFNNGLYLISGLDTNFVVSTNFEYTENNILTSVNTDSIGSYVLTHSNNKKPFTFIAKHTTFTRLNKKTSEIYTPYRYNVLGVEIDSSSHSRQQYFLQYNIGKGKLYIHSNPLLFTNYFLRTEQGLDYVSQVMSYLKKGEIYLDIRSQNPYYMKKGGVKTTKTGLEFILNNKELRWAWYLILMLGLTYIIFNSKREQRVIPYMASLKNTSINFAETIGRLFLYQNDHKFLVKRKMKLFIHDIKTQYKIKSNDLNSGIINELHKKTEVNITTIESLIGYYNSIINKKTKVTEVDLDEFFSKIENLEFQIEKLKRKRLEKNKTIENGR